MFSDRTAGVRAFYLCSTRAQFGVLQPQRSAVFGGIGVLLPRA